MLIQEALGYDQFGRRYISREEMNARVKLVLSCDFSDNPESEQFYKPLDSYQNGRRTFPELVQARHEDGMARLKARYQDFFKWPASREFRSYQKKKEDMERDFEAQKRWLGFYNNNENRRKALLNNVSDSTWLAVLFMSVGTLGSLSQPEYAVMATLCYLGSILNFAYALHNRKYIKELPKDSERIKMVLEDWHKPDRFARYDRAKTNDQLMALNKKRPTQNRRDKKRALIAKYRADHPRCRV